MKKIKVVFIALAVLPSGIAAGLISHAYGSSAPQSASATSTSGITHFPNAEEMKAMLDSPELTPEQKTILRQDPGKAANYIKSVIGRNQMNSKPLDLYGKIVDQNGQPISGVQVKGDITLAVSPVSSGSKEVAVVSDTAGKFQFTGLHGISLGVIPQKAGYEFNGKANWNSDYKPDPANPMVFTMWKLKGAEPMVHAKFSNWIPYDGTPSIFNLTTGKVSASGDLKITLLRDPIQVKRGRDHFDWSVQVEIAGGGLIETTDGYKYLAPESGYKPKFEFSIKKDDLNWTQKLIKDFYVHTGNNTYGRIHIDLTTDSDRPDGTGLSVEAYLNPSGSRNLEFDPAKQIKSK